MAEEHATLTAQGQETTPIALAGNFSLHISGKFKGGVALYKKFADQADYVPVKNGLYFRPDDIVGHEPETGVTYKLVMFTFGEGSAYVRLADGN